MEKRYKVGILGATGMVGQNYIRLLEDHPWFEISAVLASPRSAGKNFEEAVKGRWQMPTPIPNKIAKLKVKDVSKIEEVKDECDFVFSCFEMDDKELIKKYEEEYAKAGLAVVSNASAHRWTEDVPMLLPEINHSHTEILKEQKAKRGFDKGFIAVKPNCSLQSYMTPIFALEEAGYEVESLIITTLQAVSGAGYPGVPSLDMVDNVVPFIGGEESKSEKEPLKILGKVEGGKLINRDDLKISATCTRVPVVDGHTAIVSLKFKNKKPTKEQILEIWEEFKSVPQEMDLPFAPVQPIIYSDEDNRPQPRKDRDNDKGMAVTIGRLRECEVMDYKFVALSHNTVRGAAGGGILNAELLVAKREI
jgi:aspartate-semialdehyde dehydrogenase